MKINYLLGLLALSFILMVSCSSDDDDNNVSGVKRLTKIEELNGDGDYKLFSYNSEGYLISIEDGDEDGMQEKMNLTYNGQLINRVEVLDSELYATLNLKYKEDTVFVTGENIFRGKVCDTLIINTSSDRLLKLLGSRNITYNYDAAGNITSTSYRIESLTYDNNPSFYSTVGAPFWFLNYIYEYYDFMESYAGVNNILGLSNSNSDTYSYEYGADKYPVRLFIKDSTYEDESSEYKIEY